MSASLPPKPLINLVYERVPIGNTSILFHSGKYVSPNSVIVEIESIVDDIFADEIVLNPRAIPTLTQLQSEGWTIVVLVIVRSVPQKYQREEIAATISRFDRILSLGLGRLQPFVIVTNEATLSTLDRRFLHNTIGKISDASFVIVPGHHLDHPRFGLDTHHRDDILSE